MPRNATKGSRQRKAKTLTEIGLSACALGIAFIIVPLFMSKSLIAQALSPLKYVGMLALLIGIAALWIDWLRKRQPSKQNLVEVIPIAPKADAPFANVKAHAPSPSGVSEHTRALSPAAGTAPERATAWSPAVFEAIEWRRFEAVCEALFAQAGFETKSQSHGADGGVDIWLYSRHSKDSVALIVQCKHWRGKEVGVKELREFLGVMASNKIMRGTYATTSTYTSEALKFANSNGISALDANGLLALIAKRSEPQQQALLDVAYEGEYWRPTCASCGVKMLSRTPSKGGAAFWGCANYPRCRSMLPMAKGAAR
ncbi:MAG: restriction endonuclease [Burkholderiales bacterium]|nr:MAG: restriction endonuclease [Burkholderiales bacterium]